MHILESDYKTLIMPLKFTEDFHDHSTAACEQRMPHVSRQVCSTPVLHANASGGKSIHCLCSCGNARASGIPHELLCAICVAAQDMSSQTATVGIENKSLNTHILIHGQNSCQSQAGLKRVRSLVSSNFRELNTHVSGDGVEIILRQDDAQNLKQKCPRDED